MPTKHYAALDANKNLLRLTLSSENTKYSFKSIHNNNGSLD